MENKPYSPRPWSYRICGKCDKTGKEFGDILASNGYPVADAVYKDDADTIIEVVNALP